MSYQQFIIKAMNYDHGGSHDSDACNMQMLFNWDTEKLCIIFTWWRFEFLRFALRKYDTKIQVSYSQLQEGRDANSEEVANTKITYVQQLVLFMTYNGFLMISVIIGAAIGYFVFQDSYRFGESAILIKQELKQKISKTYRHPTLDKKLTARRVTQEARCLFKCRKSGVDTPVLYFVNTENNNEYIQNKEKQDELAEKIGIALAKNPSQSLVIIDFGLSYVSSLPEDKAVDLYFANILEYYQKNYKASQGILSKLAEVRLREGKGVWVG
ncbi:unnamed protein product [Rhizophagus irregularis]|nr:unnamed protein product [Rhizophagus irregularis]